MIHTWHDGTIIDDECITDVDEMWIKKFVSDKIKYKVKHDEDTEHNLKVCFKIVERLWPEEFL